MDITNPHAVESAFLTTYAKDDKPHPYREFERYDLVMTHRENEPNTGARNLSRKIDISEYRINGWFADSKPTGYDTAELLRELGWFNFSWEDKQFRALNELLAWVYSSGTINKNYRIQLIFDDQEMREECESLIEQLGAVDYTASRTGRDRETNEIGITEPGAGTGRLFVALGAPRGGKSSQRFGLPNYLPLAPTPVRKEFAARYLENRGTKHPNYAERELHIQEKRPDSYLDALAGFFASLTDGEVRRSGEDGIHLDRPAVKDILDK